MASRAGRPDRISSECGPAGSCQSPSESGAGLMRGHCMRDPLLPCYPTVSRAGTGGGRNRPLGSGLGLTRSRCTFAGDGKPMEMAAQVGPTARDTSEGMCRRGFRASGAGPSLSRRAPAVPAGRRLAGAARRIRSFRVIPAHPRAHGMSRGVRTRGSARWSTCASEQDLTLAAQGCGRGGTGMETCRRLHASSVFRLASSAAVPASAGRRGAGDGKRGRQGRIRGPGEARRSRRIRPAAGALSPDIGRRLRRIRPTAGLHPRNSEGGPAPTGHPGPASDRVDVGPRTRHRRMQDPCRDRGIEATARGTPPGRLPFRHEHAASSADGGEGAGMPRGGRAFSTVRSLTRMWSTEG
ncbi:hypothetical protein HRbin39_00804 [bacterium HR39]|nr:hypothetical protein HRbin39_00804 [bacterium HR39]